MDTSATGADDRKSRSRLVESEREKQKAFFRLQVKAAMAFLRWPSKTLAYAVGWKSPAAMRYWLRGHDRANRTIDVRIRHALENEGIIFTDCGVCYKPELKGTKE